MKRDREEPDYLVGAQLAIDPGSFVEVVKEAYLLEYGCTQNQEIAEVLGVDKSRITQIFKDYRSLKPESVHALLEPLHGARLKRAILRAWNLECFGLDIDKPKGMMLVGSPVTEKTIRRIDRQIRCWRLGDAVLTAESARKRTEDRLLLEQLLDRLHFCHVRMNRPAYAMKIGLLIAESAEKHKDPGRLAHAHAIRFLTLLRLGDSRPAELQPILATIMHLLDVAEPVPKNPFYALATDSTVRELRLVAHLVFAERGVIAPDQAFLQLEGIHLSEELKRPKLSYQNRYRRYQELARIEALLGNQFAALEYLQQSFESGGLGNVHAQETSGLIQARLARETESPEVAREMYWKLIRQCTDTFDFQHRQLAEHDLARLLAADFTEFI